MEAGTYAQFETTEGSFKVRLFDTEAPKTVENFVGLVEGTKEWTDPQTRERKKAPYSPHGVYRRSVRNRPAASAPATPTRVPMLTGIR